MLRLTTWNSYGVRINRYPETNWIKYIILAQKKPELKKVLIWFDNKIIDDLPTKSYTTINVRIRIVCGMVNKLSCLTPDMKYELMNLVYSKRKEFDNKLIEFKAKWEWRIPF